MSEIHFKNGFAHERIKFICFHSSIKNKNKKDFPQSSNKIEIGKLLRKKSVLHRKNNT